MDDYGGTTVADPYRWMEDLESPEVAAWVAAQNAVTRAHLDALPHRAALVRRLTELWSYSRTSVPVCEHGVLFYSRNSGLQRQAPVYARSGAAGSETVVLDPNVLSPDGSISLAHYAPSPDATLLAYASATGGADWEAIRVRDLATGTDRADQVNWVRFSDLSWTRDSRGFFYSRYPEPPAHKLLEAALSGHAVYYHRLGTPQSDDQLIYHRPDQPAWIVNGTVTDDGRYLLIRTYRGAENNNQLHYLAIDDGSPALSGPIVPVIETGDAEFSPIGTIGSRVYLRSDRDAPNRRVIAIDLEQSHPRAWQVVIPEQPQAIEHALLIGGRLVVHYLDDVRSRVSVHALDGTREHDITVPGIGAVSQLEGRADAPEVWLGFSSPLAPGTVYHYDPVARQLEPFTPPVAPIDAGQYETRALFATSRDGTRVPFFLTARAGLSQDGSHPAMMYGYGGFSISVLPAYRPDVPAWLELGGIFVTVNLRGGAEYGEAWHQGGMLDQKQNVFDDFIAVAEYLVREKFTSPSRLGMMGGSNGGLLVGAVMEQRPDLFAVALPAVGVMDMLRYDHFTGGRLWATEYGSASDPAQFRYLIQYSPLHNLKAGTCYPATLVTTADHDDRVVPSHSFKFTAALQAAQGCDRPALIRVETQGSHGYRPTDKLIEEKADQWAFAAKHLGLATRPMPTPRPQDPGPKSSPASR